MVAYEGLSHIALTVTDLAVSAPWYERLLGAEPVIDDDAGTYHQIVYPLTGGILVSLHDNRKAGRDERFDEFRPGLDHVSFGVADRDALEGWQARLEALGIPHGGIVDAPYGSAVSFRDPDNIALEFFAPPA